MSTYSHTSSRKPTHSTHSAHRPKSTASAPTSYLSAFTNPYYGSAKPRSVSGSTKGNSSKGYTGVTTDGYVRSAPSHGSTARARGNDGLYEVRGASTSAYKRSPRSGFLARMWHKIRRLVRDFIRYARRHPYKVIVPLITAIMGSGALAGLVKRMGGLQGLGLPGMSALGGLGVDRWINAGHGVRQGYDGFSRRGRGFEEEEEERGFMGGVDGVGMMKGAVKVASAFM